MTDIDPTAISVPEARIVRKNITLRRQDAAFLGEVATGGITESQVIRAGLDLLRRLRSVGVTTSIVIASPSGDQIPKVFPMDFDLSRSLAPATEPALEKPTPT